MVYFPFQYIFSFSISVCIAFAIIQFPIDRMKHLSIWCACWIILEIISRKRSNPLRQQMCEMKPNNRKQTATIQIQIYFTRRNWVVQKKKKKIVIFNWAIFILLSAFLSDTTSSRSRFFFFHVRVQSVLYVDGSHTTDK